MTAYDDDEARTLLVRLDERTANILTLVKKQEGNISTLTDQVLCNTKDIATQQTLLYGPNDQGGGLLGDVKCLLVRTSKLERVYWSAVFFLVGSGVLGAGIWSTFNNGFP